MMEATYCISACVDTEGRHSDFSTFLAITLFTTLDVTMPRWQLVILLFCFLLL